MVSAVRNIPGSPKGLSEETFDSFLSRENLNLPSHSFIHSSHLKVVLVAPLPWSSSKVLLEQENKSALGALNGWGRTKN